MNINATLLGEMITFSIFVWFTMRFVMPVVNQAMAERTKKIADGLAAAEEGKKTLEEAKSESGSIITTAKSEAKVMIQDAGHRAKSLIDVAKEEAETEKKRILEAATSEIQQKQDAVKEALTKEIAELAIAGAEKLLKKKFTPKASDEMLDHMIAEG